MHKIRITVELDNGNKFSDITSAPMDVKAVAENISQTKSNLILNYSNHVKIFNWSHVACINIEEIEEDPA